MNYLISFSIGPVQEFIAAARRTADLKAGSELLAKIVNAAAERGRQHGDIIYAGANKILLSAPNCDNPNETAAFIRAAAQDCLWQEWLLAKKEILKHYLLIDDLADAQIRSFLEIYSAWAPYDGANYGQKRSEVERLLAARKCLRNFAPPPRYAPSQEIMAKSPLDPAFECVIVSMPKGRGDDETESAENLRNPLHLKRTEYLDAVSLLKRTMKAPVPSTRDFAERRNQPGFRSKTEDNDGSPPSYAYYAILHADGDNMGTQLSKLNSPDEHRRFSDKISAFADAAQTIVEEKHGFLVYAGGDDVLALLPVTSAIDCALSLAKTFAEKVGVSMSAGLAIVHYKQPLSISREQAVDAERVAKKRPGKDSLCVALHTRGGAPLSLDKHWSDWASFASLATALRDGEMVRGVAYELLDLAEEFDGWEPSDGLLQKEVERIWNRKENRSEQAMPPLPAHAAKDFNSLRHFAEELIVAKFMSSRENM